MVRRFCQTDTLPKSVGPQSRLMLYVDADLAAMEGMEERQSSATQTTTQTVKEI